jgi:hypothetical protein
MPDDPFKRPDPFGGVPNYFHVPDGFHNTGDPNHVPPRIEPHYKSLDDITRGLKIEHDKFMDLWESLKIIREKTTPGYLPEMLPVLPKLETETERNYKKAVEALKAVAGSESDKFKFIYTDADGNEVGEASSVGIAAAGRIITFSVSKDKAWKYIEKVLHSYNYSHRNTWETTIHGVTGEIYYYKTPGLIFFNEEFLYYHKLKGISLAVSCNSSYRSEELMRGLIKRIDESTKLMDSMPLHAYDAVARKYASSNGTTIEEAKKILGFVKQTSKRMQNFDKRFKEGEDVNVLIRIAYDILYNESYKTAFEATERLWKADIDVLYLLGKIGDAAIGANDLETAAKAYILGGYEPALRDKVKGRWDGDVTWGEFRVRYEKKMGLI